MADIKTNRLVNTFAYSSAGILIISASAKLVSAAGKAAILDSSDILFPLKMRWLLCLAAIIEFIVAGSLLSKLQMRVKMGVLLWLALSFLIYKIGLWCIHAPPACPCLGTITQAIGISRALAWMLTDFLLLYFLLGSLTYFGFGDAKKSIKSV